MTRATDRVPTTTKYTSLAIVVQSKLVKSLSSQESAVAMSGKSKDPQNPLSQAITTDADRLSASCRGVWPRRVLPGSVRRNVDTMPARMACRVSQKAHHFCPGSDPDASRTRYAHPPNPPSVPSGSDADDKTSATSRRPLLRPASIPGVTIIRPLCGLEHNLVTVIESTMRLNYPKNKYEVIFAVQDEADPSLDVVRMVLARFPDVQARIVIGQSFTPACQTALTHRRRCQGRRQPQDQQLDHAVLAGVE